MPTHPSGVILRRFGPLELSGSLFFADYARARVTGLKAGAWEVMAYNVLNAGARVGREATVTLHLVAPGRSWSVPPDAGARISDVSIPAWGVVFGNHRVTAEEAERAYAMEERVPGVYAAEALERTDGFPLLLHSDGSLTLDMRCPWTAARDGAACPRCTAVWGGGRRL